MMLEQWGKDRLEELQKVENERLRAENEKNMVLICQYEITASLGKKNFPKDYEWPVMYQVQSGPLSGGVLI